MHLCSILLNNKANNMVAKEYKNDFDKDEEEEDEDEEEDEEEEYD